MFGSRVEPPYQDAAGNTSGTRDESGDVECPLGDCDEACAEPHLVYGHLKREHDARVVNRMPKAGALPMDGYRIVGWDDCAFYIPDPR